MSEAQAPALNEEKFRYYLKQLREDEDALRTCIVGSNTALLFEGYVNTLIIWAARSDDNTTLTQAYREAHKILGNEGFFLTPPPDREEVGLGFKAPIADAPMGYLFSLYSN